MSGFIGQSVVWNLSYDNLTRNNDGSIRISFGSIDSEGLTYMSELIVCEINEEKFPLIKILQKGTPLRLIGKIKEIDSISITLDCEELQIIKDENGQIYFPHGSRDDLIAFLECKIIAAKDIKIVDTFLDADILKIIEVSASNSNVSLLGLRTNISQNFIDKVKAFNRYFDKNVMLKTNNKAHARFWIIDSVVYQVDSSLRNNGGNKATTIIKIEEIAESIKKDFDIWWAEGQDLLLN